MPPTTSEVAALCRDLTAARAQLQEKPGVGAALNVQASKRLLATAVHGVRASFRIV